MTVASGFCSSRSIFSGSRLGWSDTGNMPGSGIGSLGKTSTAGLLLAGAGCSVNRLFALPLQD